MTKLIIGKLDIDKNILNSVWKLAWPVMLGMLVQTFMGIVDIFFVNRMGVDQSAAVVLSDSIFGVLFVFSNLISVGSLSLIARYMGKGDFNNVKTLSVQAVYYTMLIGIGITLFSLMGLNFLLGLFDLTDSVFHFSRQYLIIRVIGLTFAFLNETFRSMMHGMGDSYTPMKILILSNILNIILTPVLIFGFFIIPGFGVVGASSATVIAIVFATIILYRRYLISFSIHTTREFRKILRFSFLYLKDILNIGIFSTVSHITRPFTGMIMFRIAAFHSTYALAAFGNGGRLIGMMFIILQGLQVACSVLVGQNMGSGNESKVKRIISESLKLALLNVFAFGILFFIFPRYLLWFFINDPDVVAIGINYLRIVYIGVIFCAFTVIFGGYFIGIGFTKPSMIASLIANYVIKLPIAILFIIVLSLDLNWLWYAISLSIIGEAFVLIYWYRKKKLTDQL